MQSIHRRNIYITLMLLLVVRLLVNLDSESEVPYDHSYFLYSSILSALRNTNPGLASDIHNNPHFPRYCMSQLLPGGKREFSKTGIIADRFIFLISSLEAEILDKIKHGLELQGHIILGSNILLIHSITLETTRISSGIINMISRSPIVLKHQGKYVTSKDDIFSSVLQANIISKYAKVKGTLPKIQFMRITNSKSKLSNLKGTGIPSSMISFTISADYDLLDFIQNTGIGAKTQIGFGFIEEQKNGVDYDL